MAHDLMLVALPELDATSTLTPPPGGHLSLPPTPRAEASRLHKARSPYASQLLSHQAHRSACTDCREEPCNLACEEKREEKRSPNLQALRGAITLLALPYVEACAAHAEPPRGSERRARGMHARAGKEGGSAKAARNRSLAGGRR